MAGGVADERQLEEFGYKQELPRVLRLWTNWAIGFAFISPIVGLYTVVALGATTAGPAWVWSVPIVHRRQMLVALCLRAARRALADGRRDLPVVTPADRAEVRLVGGLDLHLGA